MLDQLEVRIGLLRIFVAHLVGHRSDILQGHLVILATNVSSPLYLSLHKLHLYTLTDEPVNAAMGRASPLSFLTTV